MNWNWPPESTVTVRMESINVNWLLLITYIFNENAFNVKNTEK